MSTITVWNITPATKESPTNLHIYGKVVKPGASAKVDESWVRQYPQPLTSAQANKTVHVGEALPQWYDKALEEQMKKITHNGQAPSILKGEGFHPTQMKPGDSFELEDKVVEKLELDEQPWMSVDDIDDTDQEDAQELEEEMEPEEAPKKKAPVKEEAEESEPEEEEAPAKKKRNLRRGKKKD